MSQGTYPKSRIRKSQYRDIDLNLTRNPLNNDVVRLSTDQSIAQSVRNLVLIRFYEKWFRPNIGNFAAGALFELQLPEYQSVLKSSLIKLIRNYEPRVIISGEEDIKISGLDSTDGNSLKIEIRYLIKGKTDVQEIEVYVKRTL